MADVDELDSRLDGIDVESILSRVERRGPLTFSRKRCLYQAPEFVKRLSGDETVEEGSTVRFECKVVGFPKPSLTWYKDDMQMKDDSRIKIEETDNGAYAIVIETTSKCDDGTFRCRAENAEGSSSSTIYLSVKAKSPKRAKTQSKAQKHAVSMGPLFPTIAEKVSEEELEENILKKQPPSPLSHLYDCLTMASRHTWPEFLGEWAFTEGEAGDKNGTPSEHAASGEDMQRNNDTDERVLFEIGEPKKDSVSLEKNLSQNKNENNENKVKHKMVQSKDVNINNNVCLTNNHVRSITDENANLQHQHPLTSDRPLSVTGNKMIRSDNLQSMQNNKIVQGQNEETQCNKTRSAFVSTDACVLKNSENTKTFTWTKTRPLSLPTQTLTRTVCPNELIQPTQMTIHTVTRAITDDPSRQRQESEGTLNKGLRNLTLKELIFVLTGFTFVALCADMSPLTFVLIVFIAEVLYCILRFISVLDE